MNMKREPVAIVSAIIAVIETLIALLVAFGLKLTGEQVGAIMAFVTAVGGLISILIVRPRVTLRLPEKSDMLPLQAASRFSDSLCSPSGRSRSGRRR
jgi:uncharacterized membrane protein YkgB